jgi:hypothetical protein
LTTTLSTLRVAVLAAAWCGLAACSDSSQGPSTPAPATPPPPLAPSFLSRFAPLTQVSVLLLNIDYPDDGAPPAAHDEIDRMIAGFQERIRTESFGLATASVDVVDVVMPQGIAYYTGGVFAFRVRRDALRTAGYGTAVPAGYHCVAMLGPKVWTPPLVGLQIAFGAYMSVIDDLLFLHEVLHTYDRTHASSFDPAAPDPNAGNVEYGDHPDPMGEVFTGAVVRAHKGLHGKARRELGWLPPERFLRIDASAAGSSATYTLGALEDGVGLLGIEIPTSTPDRSYWLQYRGDHPSLLGPVVTKVGVAIPADSLLLDPTPGLTATSWSDAFIAVGVPFTSPEGYVVETLHVDAGVSTTVRVTLPPSMPVTDRSPVIGFAVPTVPTDVFTGQAKVRVTAYDPDDTGLAAGTAPVDFAGIANVRYQVLSIEDGLPPLFDWTTADPHAEFTFDTTTLADGLYLLRVQAIPKSGLGNAASIELQIFVDNSQ